MAKSIRSKVKKRNRTEMRRTVGDPHQKKLQARCTAKILKSVAFGGGQGITKLKSILHTAQATNPPTKEVSKNKFSFRHPDAPPPFEDDDDEVATMIPPSLTPLAAAGSLADAGISMDDDEAAMSDVGDGSAEKEESAPGVDASGDPLATMPLDGRKMTEMATKLKKKLRRERKRNFVKFPALEN